MSQESNHWLGFKTKKPISWLSLVRLAFWCAAGFFVYLSLGVAVAQAAAYTIPQYDNWSNTGLGTQRWTKDKSPYLLQGGCTNNSLPQGRTLTIDPGVVVKFGPPAQCGYYQYPAQLIIYGTLVANGTADEPVIFTSWHDDTVGGDTNGNGAASLPQPGDWARIQLGASATTVVNLANTIIRYGGNAYYGMLQVWNPAPQLEFSNLELAYSSNYGLTSFLPLNVQGSSFHHHTGYALQALGGQVDARFSQWGSDTGPTVATNPGGTGEKIIGNVLYDPWMRKVTKVRYDPVIIVPGIMGSAKKNGEWVIDPILHTYDDLIETLKVNGYTEGQDLFTFPYDWQQAVSFTGEQLGQKIQQIKTICQCQKIDLISHSMGGLVARSYAQGNSYYDDIDQIIFLGTPHEGSPFAYLLWEGGELTPQFFSTSGDRLLEIIFTLKSLFSGFSSRFSYIQNNVFSVRDLLPTSDYLLDASTGMFKSYPSGYPRNLLLELLNTPTSEGKLSERHIRVTNIVGNIEPNTVDGKQIDRTLGTIRVVADTSRLPQWEHGYPENYNTPFTDQVTNHGLEFTEGDGRVPISSSTHDFPSIYITRTDRDLHPNLVKGTAWPYISQALLGTTAPEQPAQTVVNDLLIIPVFSPVDIQVIDPLGRSVGSNFVTGGEVNEIPLAFYSGTEEEFIVIPNPLNGQYQVKARGTDSGSYKLQVNYVSDTASTQASFTGNTTAGLTSALVFDFSPTAPTSTTITPLDTVAPTTTVSVAGVQGTNDWYISDAIISLQAQDNDGGVGVFSTEYSFDGGVHWSTYAEPLLVTSEEVHTLLYRSQDFVGNLEEPKVLVVKIDKTPPEARIYFDKIIQKLTFEGVDNLTAHPGLIIIGGQSYDKDIRYVIKDEAGHTLSLFFSELKQRGKEIKAELREVQYNTQPKIILPDTEIKIEWSLNKKPQQLKELEQKLEAKNQFKVKAKYHHRQNTTEVMITRGVGGERVTDRYSLPGIVILKFVTDSGNISYEF